MTDILIRAFSRARWQAVAVNRGILIDGIDAQGQPALYPAPGIGVDEIGNMQVTPAVLDAQGNVVTPAVIDTWWSVNLRLYDKAEAADNDTLYPGETDSGFRFLKSKLVRFVRAQATPVTVNGIRAYQFGTGVNRFQILDPRDIATPYRVWAGGMAL
jgi:hypothetical protein